MSSSTTIQWNDAQDWYANFFQPSENDKAHFTHKLNQIIQKKKFKKNPSGYLIVYTQAVNKKINATKDSLKKEKYHVYQNLISIFEFMMMPSNDVIIRTSPKVQQLTNTNSSTFKTKVELDTLYPLSKKQLEHYLTIEHFSAENQTHLLRHICPECHISSLIQLIPLENLSNFIIDLYFPNKKVDDFADEQGEEESKSKKQKHPLTAKEFLQQLSQEAAALNPILNEQVTQITSTKLLDKAKQFSNISF